MDKKTVNITIPFPEALHRLIKAEADKEERSISAQVRKILLEHYEEKTNK